MSHEFPSDYYSFAPELIVEVTSVCDRACLGCYAPNVVSRNDHELTLQQRPELFLRTSTLREKLIKVTSPLGRRLTSLSFRGGEPTCHPRLTALLETGLQHTRQLFVESHGRWVLPGQRGTGIDAAGLLSALGHPNITLKISFDSMHKISAGELEQVLATLDEKNVNWLVAITEIDYERFVEQRDQCRWIPNSKIVLQPKAVRPLELYTPTLGVVRTGGEHTRSLSAKTSF